MKILVANGVNLDLLGSREPEIYGVNTLEDMKNLLLANVSGVSFEFFQSNSESQFIEKISSSYDGIILNPGAWTHTSIAILDRILAVEVPYIEVHQFDKLGSYLSDMWEKDDSTLLNEWCDIDFYLAALTFAEWFYQMLRHKGWKPQQAREVLPLATKSQLIHTAFVDDWKHFFALRADGISGPPHPNAKLVAEPLKQEFIKRGLL